MKVSEQWLRTFVQTGASITELADQLTNAGIEVDALEVGVGETPQGVMTLKIPPNRGDCCSMEGIARELAALNGQHYQPNAGVLLVTGAGLGGETLSVQIEVPVLCPRYLGCIIKGVNTAAISPIWLQERLKLAGIKSVSVVVDVLSYVMLELGQPLHAFDLDTLGSSIVVRKSKEGESITLLDGRIIALDSETLVVADVDKPQAIAGIMGGLASSVTDNTRDVFIESAYFNPVVIRLAAQRFGLRTEASHRFERGVDPNLPRRALERVIGMLVDIAGGTAGSIIEETIEAQLPQSPVIFLRKKRVSALLGVSLSGNEIVEILERLLMRVEVEPEGFQVRPPSFRQDILLEVDLIEEIARLYGFHRIPTARLTGEMVGFPVPETHIPSSRFSALLVDRGFSEVITYSFVDPKLLALFNFSVDALCLANPISVDMAAMRVSLWPGLLQAVQYNQNRQSLRARFFEIGTCFPLVQDGQVMEKTVLAGVCAGSVHEEQWGTPARKHDYYDAKQEVEALCSLMGVRCGFERAEHPALHPGQSAKVILNQNVIGYVGALHPRIVKALELEGPVLVFELDILSLQESKRVRCQILSKFPTIRRDIAMVVDKAVLAEALILSIRQYAGPWLHDVFLFDVYEGKGIDPDKKSVAMGLILQHPLRTLEVSEGNDILKQVVSMLISRFNATLRE